MSQNTCDSTKITETIETIFNLFQIHMGGDNQQINYNWTRFP